MKVKWFDSYDDGRYDDLDIAFINIEDEFARDNAVWRLQSPIIAVYNPKVGYTHKQADQRSWAIVALCNIGQTWICGGKQGACNKVLHYLRTQEKGEHWFQTDIFTAEMALMFPSEHLNAEYYDECIKNGVDYWFLREITYNEVK